MTDTLFNTLSATTRDGKLLTVQPGGNYGDHLIYMGFNKRLSDTDINQVRLSEETIRSDKPRDLSLNIISNIKMGREHLNYIRRRVDSDVSTVYIHGGGNFNDMYGGGIECYKTVARYFDCPIVIGPQSCQFESTNPTAIFGKVNNRTYFFCREKYSYEIISDATKNLDHVSVYTHDDTAFYMTQDDLPVRELSEEYTLLAMRMDEDSADPIVRDDIQSPIRVSDVSELEESFSQWVTSVARAEKIYTDRLHNAILGHILGKRVEMYDTGYHKNRGVYEHSLATDENVDFNYVR